MCLTRRSEFERIDPFCNQAIRASRGPLVSIIRNADDDSGSDEGDEEGANAVVSRDFGHKWSKEAQGPKDPVDPRSDPILRRTFSRSTMTSPFLPPTTRTVVLNVRQSLHSGTFKFPAKPFLLAHYLAGDIVHNETWEYIRCGTLNTYLSART